jgi:hypothetical protein
MGYGTLRASLTTLQAVQTSAGMIPTSPGMRKGNLAAVEDYLAARSRRIVGQIGAGGTRKPLAGNYSGAVLQANRRRHISPTRFLFISRLLLRPT